MESLFLLHAIPRPPLTLSLPLCPLQFGSHIWQLNLHIITFASHHPSTLPSHDHEAPGSAAAAQVSTECGILTCYICRLLNIMLFMLICFHSKLSCHTNCTGGLVPVHAPPSIQDWCMDGVACNIGWWWWWWGVQRSLHVVLLMSSRGGNGWARGRSKSS